jgi:REP element-mobilizing transposase RayT
MPQSIAQNLVHLIFSTKHRHPFLKDDSTRTELHKYTAGILRNWESPAIEINSVEDHVHILFVLSKNHSLAKIVEEVKKSSSAWIKTKDDTCAQFYWQAGYGAFSVSQSQVENVRQYIRSQQERHQRRTFQDEFRQFLLRHGIAIEEEHVWD